MSMVKNENYVQISGWMINELNLSGNELFVYALIHGFSQDGKSLFKGSISYIQEWLNCGSRQTVISVIKKLIEKHLIEKNVVVNGKEVVGCEYWTVASRQKKDIPQTSGSPNSGLPPVQISDDPSLKNGLPPSPNSGHNILNLNSSDTATAVKNSLEEIFGKNFFDSEFPKKAAEFLTAQKIDNVSSYFVFLQNKAKARKLTNPRGFVHKLFFQQDIAQEFKNTQQQSANKQQAEKHQIRCPVCGDPFALGYNNCCPKCDFSVSDFKNEKEIAHHKKYIALDKKARDAYDEEFRSFKSELPIMARLAYFNSPQGKSEKAKFIAMLDKKYGFG